MNREILIIVLSILAVLAGLGAYAFGLQEVDRLYAETVAFEEERATLVLAAQQSAAARGALGKLEADEAFVGARFAKTDDIVSFLAYLEEGGAARGTYVDVVSVSDATSDGMISVALRITGSFVALMDTLDSFEYGTYTLSTRSVSVSQDPEGGWEMTAILDVLTQTP
jgi:hypothetical protein